MFLLNRVRRNFSLNGDKNTRSCIRCHLFISAKLTKFFFSFQRAVQSNVTPFHVAHAGTVRSRTLNIRNLIIHVIHTKDRLM